MLQDRHEDATMIIDSDIDGLDAQDWINHEVIVWMCSS